MATLETPSRIEPCHLASVPGELADLIGEVIGVSARLGDRLHADTAASLRDLVAVMNCYYSNLIEGHNTRPREIQAALDDDLDGDEQRRDLQLEARAHIRVQREIDRRHAAGELGEAASLSFVRWLHEAFYDGAPESLLRIEAPAGTYLMEPGRFRSRPEQHVVVGRHQPPSSGAVGAFMAHFEDRYRLAGLGPVRGLVATAAAHHRFNYVHPFPDGNGRVSRLMSHAMALQVGVGAKGLWSISRGLARGLGDRGEYPRMMDAADEPRRGDLDGRGNLSEAALVDFVTWFTRVALDQLTFMARLFEFDALSERLTRHVVEQLGASDESAAIVAEVLRHGSVARGDVARITGRPERTARNQLKLLTDEGLLASQTPKGAVSLRFPTDVAEALFPRLFPAHQD